MDVKVRFLLVLVSYSRRLDVVFLRFFGNFSTTMTGLMILIIGKGPMYLGPSIFDGCLDCMYLAEKYTFGQFHILSAPTFACQHISCKFSGCHRALFTLLARWFVTVSLIWLKKCTGEISMEVQALLQNLNW